MSLPLPLSSDTQLTLLLPRDLDAIAELLTEAQIDYSVALKADSMTQLQHRFMTILANQHEQGDNQLPLLCGIEHQQQGLVGIALLKPDAQQPLQVELELGLCPAARGLGLATKVCRQLRDLAFEHHGVTTLLAHANEDNHSAKRVFEKSGLGRVQKDYGFFTDGQDRCWFKIDRAQWLRSKQVCA